MWVWLRRIPSAAGKRLTRPNKTRNRSLALEVVVEDLKVAERFKRELLAGLLLGHNEGNHRSQPSLLAMSLDSALVAHGSQ